MKYVYQIQRYNGGWEDGGTICSNLNAALNKLKRRYKPSYRIVRYTVNTNQAVIVWKGY